MDRRLFLQCGLFAGASGILGAAAARADEAKLKPVPPITPSEIEGPFYPLQAQKDVDFDLTRIEGRGDVAQGTQVYIVGRVIDQHGQPVTDATVDLWQANHHGRYRHPHESNTAPLDPAFQGWAIVPSGEDGGFRFKTIVPGSYPVSAAWSRPPHIHFKVTKRGFTELTTQMYFPGQPLNKRDRLLLRHPEEQQSLMIARLHKAKQDDLPVYAHTLVIERL